MALGEDLAQDVLARAMLSWRRISAGGNVEAYLRRSLVNARTSWWRRHHRPAAPATEYGPDLADSVATRDVVLRALAQLPPRQRAAVVLRYYETSPMRRSPPRLSAAPHRPRPLPQAIPTLRHLLHDSFTGPGTE